MLALFLGHVTFIMLMFEKYFLPNVYGEVFFSSLKLIAQVSFSVRRPSVYQYVRLLMSQGPLS